MGKLFVAISLGFLLGCCVPLATEAQQSSNQLLIRSPRLVALEKQLKSGDAAALDNFWREIKQQGTPLVEAIPGEDKYVLVTFLWRGGAETKNVILFSALPGGADAAGDFSEDQLLRNQLVSWPGTNVWFKTSRLRKDGRFTYYLSPNDSLLPFDQRKDEDWEPLQPDPLNPRHFVIHEEPRDYVRSVVELPGVPPVQWLEARPDVLKGRTEEHQLTSKILGNDRRFWVYTPPGYAERGEPYGLLVLFDGWVYTKMIPTTTILDNLLTAHRIRPLVVVMVDHKNRNLETSCYEPLNEFLVRELIPWVRGHYRITSNPAETIVAGGSGGGLAAAFAGLRHPEIFGNVLSLFGYFSWDPGEDQALDKEDLEWEWIIRQFAASPKLPLHFALMAGLFDSDPYPKLRGSPSSLQANRHMRDVLLAKGYTVAYREIAGGDEVFAAAVALPDGLISLAAPSPTNRNSAAGQATPSHIEPAVSLPQPVRLLTSNEQYADSWPTLSPDGKRVVFTRQRVERGSKPTLWVMPLDGDAPRQLIPPDFKLISGYPAWSPDGATIAFAAEPDENHGGIWLIGSDGTNLRRLTDEEKFDDMAPAWSPDGKWIVFSRGPTSDEPTNDLWQISLDGWQRQLTRGNKWEGKSSVSPDGHLIAFASDRPARQYPDTNVWIMSVDAGEATAWEFTSGGGAVPQWSPDGNWIAFTSMRDGSWGLYLKRIGENRVIKVAGPTGKCHPEWLPDGNSIVFDLYRVPDHGNIAVIDVGEIVRRAK